jgi:hypothetical protein
LIDSSLGIDSPTVPQSPTSQSEFRPLFVLCCENADLVQSSSSPSPAIPLVFFRLPRHLPDSFPSVFFSFSWPLCVSSSQIRRFNPAISHEPFSERLTFRRF